MNKSEFVASIAAKANLSKKDAENFANAWAECIADALAKDEKVQIVGFGTFETRTRAAREGINPQTKKKITIPATKAPAFKPGKALKDAVN